MSKQKRNKKKRDPKRTPPAKKLNSAKTAAENTEIRFSFENELFRSECIIGFGNIDIPLDTE